MPLNSHLLNDVQQLLKHGFVPPGGGGDPSMGGGAGRDPMAAAGGGMPGMMPGGGGAPPPGGGMPPGGDPMAAAGGMPPAGDPMAGGGIQAIIQQAVQAAMQGQQGGAPGAGGKGKAGKPDLVAEQLYKMNVILTAIMTGLNKSGCDIVIPPEAILGPPPGSDPTMAMNAAGGPAGMGGPGAMAAPGTDPATGQPMDPAAQQQQQAPQQLNVMPSLAMPGGGQGAGQGAKTAAVEEPTAQRIGTPMGASLPLDGAANVMSRAEAIRAILASARPHAAS